MRKGNIFPCVFIRLHPIVVNYVSWFNIRNFDRNFTELDGICEDSRAHVVLTALSLMLTISVQPSIMACSKDYNAALHGEL